MDLKEKKPYKKEENNESQPVVEGVSSKKKKPKENKNFLLFAGIILVLVLVISVFFVFFYSPYKFRFDIEGVPYLSNEYVPTEFFNEFKQNEVVYVSPIMQEGVTDSLTFNALSLWQIVLIGNNVRAVQLIRVKGVEGNFVYCYTNDGNVFVSRQVSFEECSLTLNNPQNTVVFIEQSKEKKVLLEKNKLSVFSPIGAVSTTNFYVMRQIFPNAKELIDIVNEKIYGIQ